MQVAAVLVAALALAGSARAPLPQGLLAFSGNCQACPAAGEGAALFTVRPDREKPKLTIANAADPRWSPNGRQLVFARQTLGGTSLTGFSELWVSNADGSGLRRLTSGNSDSEADWSPTGKRIVFVRSDPDAAPVARSALWTIRRDGSDPHLLLRARMGGARDPEWSSDGRRILFAASAERIYEVGSDGRGLRLLRIRGTSPRLSPGGRRLAVMFVTKRELSINVLDRKTGRVTAFRLGKTAVASGPLAWSADGQWLAYGRGREVRDEIGGISTTFDLWYLRLSDGRRRIILRNMDLDGLDWRGR